MPSATSDRKWSPDYRIAVIDQAVTAGISQSFRKIERDIQRNHIGIDRCQLTYHLLVEVASQAGNDLQTELLHRFPGQSSLEKCYIL